MSIICLVCATPNSISTQQCVFCGYDCLSGSSNNSSTSHHLRSGTTLKQGDYRIDKLLGEGGFGITYQGTYNKNNALVAIKEMWPEKAARKGTVSIWPPSISPQHKSQQLSKFKLEASNQQNCDHPNIAQVYDWFDENDTCYIVMEFIQGKSLLSILESRGCLTEQEVIRYFSQVVLALRTIHSNNFLHRDIKPENILIDSQDRAVLIDFGAAREFMSNQSVQMTQVLTPGYAPYEQYSKTGKRGPSTDFYALFASMYELLTGKLPIDAPDRAASIVGKSPDPLILPRKINPAISASMEQAILTGMRIRADERFQTADEVLAAIAPLTSVGISVDKHINHNPLDTSSKQVKLICKQPNAPIPEFGIGGNVVIGVFELGAKPVDIDLSSFLGNETISRKHAEIFNEAGVWKIKDLGSSNGVFIKAAGQTRFSARITAPTALNDGDEIAIAKVKFQFIISSI
jgi:eukaryotic-like serine/threonine-protein kinase